VTDSTTTITAIPCGRLADDESGRRTYVLVGEPEAVTESTSRITWVVAIDQVNHTRAVAKTRVWADSIQAVAA
jgi:hypothetical protein